MGTPEKDAEYFSKLLNGSNELLKNSSRPWKWAVVCLVITVVACLVAMVIMNFRYMETIDFLTKQIIALD